VLVSTATVTTSTGNRHPANAELDGDSRRKREDTSPAEIVPHQLTIAQCNRAPYAQY
jgi:hypothetical protein